MHKDVAESDKQLFFRSSKIDRIAEVVSVSAKYYKVNIDYMLYDREAKQFNKKTITVWIPKSYTEVVADDAPSEMPHA